MQPHSQSMSYAQFQELASPGAVIPVFYRLNADFLTPVAAYLKLRDPGHNSFLLESAEHGEQVGRYSFIGSQPFRILSARNGKTTLAGAVRNRLISENFFQILRTQLGTYRGIHFEGFPSFTGGLVGFLGYEMVNFLEELPPPKTDPVGIEDAHLGFYHDLVVFDHLKNEVVLISNVFVERESDLRLLFEEAQHRLQALRHRLNRPLPKMSPFAADPSRLRSNFGKKEFMAAVRKAKELILQGEIFQVVLSQRFELEFTGDPFQVYRTLRVINPSPYMFYLDMSGYQLIGSSPESLVKVRKKHLEMVPIAGTRPRGKDPEEDRALERNLRTDPKELAEHVMLVDLARNDLGRVSRYGSVKVSDFKTVERYSHVMHLISRVHGRLRDHFTAVEALKATFPAGTVSGAPKVRAMEIIHQLEPEKRGVYAGAVGYFDFSGNMDFCIAIRMIVAKQGRLFLQAGAGIVADSDPEAEYLETINKSKALQSAIQQAAEGIHDFVYR